MLRPTIQKMLGPRLSNLRFVTAAPLAYAPGHFYSPICDPPALRRRYRDPRIAAPPTRLPGIDLRHGAQVALWESWRPLLHDINRLFADGVPRRYQLPSSSYDIGDATIYAAMLRYLQPQRLIEVGSGSSSAVALDVIDNFLTSSPRITFIEPYPAFLESLLKQDDRTRVEVIASDVQEVEPAFFDDLEFERSSVYRFHARRKNRIRCGVRAVRGSAAAPVRRRCSFSRRVLPVRISS